MVTPNTNTFTSLLWITISWYYIQYATLTIIAHLCRMSFLIHHPNRIFPTIILTQRSYHLLHVSNTGDERSHPPSFIPIPPSLMMAKCLGFTSVHCLNPPAPMSHHIGWKAFWTAAPPGHDHPAKGSPCLSTGRTWPMAYSQRSHLHYCHQYHPERPIQAIYSYSIYCCM